MLTFWIYEVWDLKPEDKDQPINWAELKTSEDIQSEGDKAKFERKLLKFWIQSFLLGVPKIIVGFRSKNGVLLRLEEIPTQSIPGNVKRQGKSWDGNTCVNFANAFLECKYSLHTAAAFWEMVSSGEYRKAPTVLWSSYRADRNPNPDSRYISVTENVFRRMVGF